MAFLGGLLTAAIPALVGAASSAFGAKKQNEAAKAASKLQMDFQERMSNTQYQRAMADMKKAGLNPILAYQKGGAGTPGGSTYSPVNVGAAATAGAGAGVSSALAQRRFKLEEDINRAATAKAYSEVTKNSMEYEYTHQATKNAYIQGQILKQQREMNVPSVTSAKSAEKLYRSPGGDFFKWWQMLKRKGQ